MVEIQNKKEKKQNKRAAARVKKGSKPVNTKKLSSKTRKNNFTEGIKNKLFPVVAIGASAGGLEAYTALIKNLRHDTGMAFVIIQHMDPKHKSFLTEILSRETDLKVNIAKNGIKPEPDNIYVIPPAADIIFRGGQFQTIPRPPASRAHMPVDIFM